MGGTHGEASFSNANVCATVNSIVNMLFETVVYCLTHNNVIACFAQYPTLHIPIFSCIKAVYFIGEREFSLSTWAHFFFWYIPISLSFSTQHHKLHIAQYLSTISGFPPYRIQKRCRIRLYFQFVTSWDLDICMHISAYRAQQLILLWTEEYMKNNFFGMQNYKCLCNSSI